MGVRSNLLTQNLKIIRNQFDNQGLRSVSTGIMKSDTNYTINLVTWQGLNSLYKKDLIQDYWFDLVVVDEFHNAGTNRRLEILSSLKKTNVVGMSATPVRAGGLYLNPEDYGFKLIYQHSYADCIKRGLLTPLFIQARDTGITLSPRVESKDGDLISYIVNKEVADSGIISRISKDLLKEDLLLQGIKTLVIVNSKKEAIAVKEILIKKFKTEVYISHFYSEEEDKEILRKYALPKENIESLQILVSVNRLIEGYDNPLIQAEIWISPTKSSVRFCQYLGRVSRKAPGKNFSILIEYQYHILGSSLPYNYTKFFSEEELEWVNNNWVAICPQNKLENLSELDGILNNYKSIFPAFTRNRSKGDYPQNKDYSVIPNTWYSMAGMTSIFGQGASVKETITNLSSQSEFQDKFKFGKKAGPGSGIPTIYYSPDFVHRLLELGLTIQIPRGWFDKEFLNDHFDIKDLSVIKVMNLLYAESTEDLYLKILDQGLYSKKFIQRMLNLLPVSKIKNFFTQREIFEMALEFEMISISREFLEKAINLNPNLCFKKFINGKEVDIFLQEILRKVENLLFKANYNLLMISNEMMNNQDLYGGIYLREEPEPWEWTWKENIPKWTWEDELEFDTEMYDYFYEDIYDHHSFNPPVFDSKAKSKPDSELVIAKSIEGFDIFYNGLGKLVFPEYFESGNYDLDLEEKQDLEEFKEKVLEYFCKQHTVNNAVSTLIKLLQKYPHLKSFTCVLSEENIINLNTKLVDENFLNISIKDIPIYNIPLKSSLSEIINPNIYKIYHIILSLDTWSEYIIDTSFGKIYPKWLIEIINVIYKLTILAIKHGFYDIKKVNRIRPIKTYKSHEKIYKEFFNEKIYQKISYTNSWNTRKKECYYVDRQDDLQELIYYIPNELILGNYILKKKD